MNTVKNYGPLAGLFLTSFGLYSRLQDAFFGHLGLPHLVEVWATPFARFPPIWGTFGGGPKLIRAK